MIAYLRHWARRYMDRRLPDFVIGRAGDPYMQRWYVIPRNRLGNIYLHRFLRDDEDRALHDHPWPSLSLVLATGYWEHLADGRRLWRKPGSATIRSATAAHRIALARGVTGMPLSAVSLFFTGPTLRNWGFHCPRGWVKWSDFVAPTENGNVVGRGCGEFE